MNPTATERRESILLQLKLKIMKRKLAVSALVFSFACMLLVSCKKDVTGNTSNNSNNPPVTANNGNNNTNNNNNNPPVTAGN